MLAALDFAKQNQIPFLPIYTLDEGWAKKDVYNLGYPRRLALSRILPRFAKHFHRFEIVLSEPEDLLEKLILEHEVFVFVNDDVEPYLVRRHQKLRQITQKQTEREHFFLCSNDLSLPADRRTTTGKLYSVFTPFKNAVWEDFLNTGVKPKADPSAVSYFSGQLKLKSVEPTTGALWAKLDQPWIVKYGQGSELHLDQLLTRPNLDQWPFDEAESLKRFASFNRQKIDSYKEKRDNLGLDATDNFTSRMSSALAWGLVSSRVLKDKILQEHPNPEVGGAQTYLTELIWREFYRYILLHHPWVLHREYQAKFQQGLRWSQGEEGEKRFLAWVRGRTGYPLVDAAMRQIQAEGWMHNRARMVVASILTKNLGVDWRWGQDYFRALLVDLDEASNNGGWQWSASVGADPKPIRIFNPYRQAEKYDSQGNYQKRWLPQNYADRPIIEHSLARKQAQERYARAK